MKKQFLLGLVAMLLPLATWAQSNLTVKVNDKTENIVFEYNGTQTLAGLSVEVYWGDTKLTDSNPTQYYYEITDGDGELVDETAKVGVGEYTVTAYGQTATYNGKTGSVTFKVEPKKVTSLTIKDNQITKEYGTNDEDIELVDFVSTGQLVTNTDDEEAEIEDFLNCLKMSRDDKYKGLEGVNDVIFVTFVGDDEATSNYEYAPNSAFFNVPLNITARKLTVEQVNAREYYKGKAFDVTNPNAKTFFKLNNVLPADASEVTIKTLTLIGEGPIEDAGDYPLEVTLEGSKAGNYTVETLEDNENAHVNLTIDKATLTVDDDADQDLSKIYGEDDPESLYDQFTFTPSHGTYPAYTLTPAELEELVEIEIADNDGSVKYSTEAGKENIVVGYDITITLIGDGAKNFVLAGYDEEDKPKFVIKPKSISKAGDLAADGFVLTVDEEAIVYNGEEYKGRYDVVDGPKSDLTTLTDDGENLVFGEDYYIYINADSKNAGTKFTLGAYGIGNYTGKIYVNNLEIAKAPLKVTPKEGAKFTKVDGQDDPDFYTLFTYETLLGEDSLNIKNVLEVKRQSGRLVNTRYLVTVTDKSNNYDVEYTNVPFYILPNAITFDVAEKAEEILPQIEQYDGETIDVTIKNLQTLMNAGIGTDKWYTLVLPFKVKVRDISNALGYAIVDIPNTNNDDEKVVAFKLHMGEVEANTLMAFKVDAPIDWESEDYKNGVTFKGVTIEAPGEDYVWATDKAGNKFVGVYEAEYAIDQNNQYFIYPADGKPYNAAQWATVHEAMVINPLTGYIEFEKATAGARIIFEEADGSTTAITEVGAEKVSAAEGWYSVDGVKLNAKPALKGIYINNGKKVVIK